ncbi:putative sporulation protein YtxC [Clostridium cavendishii DSM 21758]|uniref:Putative sporulation protein YtxC n=1 Tax=Clostridium cavendishii DSM 21758 TaxID=1121302 RepID=A0A1M6KUY5_9CLOT|nr:putative sporulation protein YtxC [Clostridium cavendishii]SHJ62771.1 putative sporulation protein YtxC [Clostridium cavendishii DSM 21758]
MLLMKLTYDGEQKFIEDIQEIRTLLKEKKVNVGIVESIEGNTHFVKLICDDDVYSKKVESIVDIYISNILYKIVIDNFRKQEMYEYLTDTYFFLKHEEIMEVEEKLMEALSFKGSISDETNIYCMNRVNNIVEKIKGCLEENREININGFLIFRMKDLVNDIELIIDKIVEKYMVEKEYKEFIKLLRYFVEIQDSKIEELNIIISKTGSYEITDNHGKDIFKDFISELAECKIGDSINIEDVIISGLITNAPKKIIIHKKENCTNEEFLDTIMNVFCERVEICNDCTLCTTKKIKI